MSSKLPAPESNAPLADWREWLQELKSMTETPDVRNAMRRAEAVIHGRRQQAKPLQAPSPFGRHAY